ncbi:MAG: hypothetical protein ACTHOU_05040 [Aureliella sp.]|jgi:hypothetical protein
MFWVREIAGWLLVVVALYLIWIALGLVMDLDTPRVVEAGVLTLGGLGVLRAGILLIRISTAARICRQDRKS